MNGTAPDDFLVGAADGLLAHFDGNEWTAVPTPFARRVRRIEAVGPREWFVVIDASAYRFAVPD